MTVNLNATEMRGHGDEARGSSLTLDRFLLLTVFVFGGVNVRVYLWRSQDHPQKLALLLPCRAHGLTNSVLGLPEE